MPQEGNRMDIKKVTVAGGGVLGSQIAFQSAYSGYDVTIWLRTEASIGRCQPKLDYLHATYLKTLDAMKESPAAYAYGLMPREDVTPQSCEDAKAKVRRGEEGTKPVTGMFFSSDEEKIKKAVEETYKMDGIYYIRTWLNEGELTVGDDIMYVLIGGDIRPHVVDALQFLVGKIKNECVIETEKY